ncbi:UNVERIFIED_CONTAM: hypothetical protein Scaly_2855500 [Sesamum calycinum]|uniref:DUF7952 domain-containing protein n=1 Tax=Sesamum calycinum TaxID=2727403 RepID=A0AAW2LGD5_9LAMI
MASILSGQNGDSIAEISREQFLRPDSDDCGEARVRPLIPSDSYDAGDAFGEPDILPRIGDEYQAELPQLLGEPANISCSRTRPHQNSLVGLPIPLTWISSMKHEGPEIFFRFPDVAILRISLKQALIPVMVRWSKDEEQEMRIRQRIFSGFRQQELLSRLLPRVSEERRSALLEVSKNFAEEKMLLVDYVSSLKALVGINILVEAVAIGTGKQDLTRMALEPLRKEPGLIDLDNEEADGNKKEGGHERAGKKKLKEDENDRPTRLRRSYLQPRTINCSMDDDTRFTVVDTSLSDGQVRELRSFPSETSNMMSISLVRTEGGAQVTLEENTGEFDTTNTITPDAYATDNLTTKPGRKRLPARKKHEENSSYQDTHTVYPDISKTSSSDLKNKKGSIDKRQSRKVPKPHLSRKQEQDDVDYTAPISKRCRRLTANGCDDARDGVIRSSIAPRSGNSMSYCSSGTREFNENVSSQVRLCQDKLPTSSSKGSLHESIECNPVSSIHAKEASPENPRTPFLIDLNLPQLSPEIEDYSVATDLRIDQNDESIKPENHCLPKSSDIEAGKEQPSTVNPLRHGTRNRPPTTRALEAVADGYLTVNRRRRSRGTSSRGNATTRPAQRARGSA